MSVTNNYYNIIHAKPLNDEGVNTLAGNTKKDHIPKYGKRFITLKWIKKGERKTAMYYLQRMDIYRAYGAIKGMVYGPDSLGRPHVHFILHQNRYIPYKKVSQKYLHIDNVPLHHNHIGYMKRHKIIP